MSELKPVTNEQIRKIALSNGFKLKTQPHGGEGLNPYVYDFARALLDQAIPEGYVLAKLEHLESIQSMCIGEIAMGYRIDANCVGELVFMATGLTDLSPKEDKAGVLGL